MAYNRELGSDIFICHVITEKTHTNSHSLALSIFMCVLFLVFFVSVHRDKNLSFFCCCFVFLRIMHVSSYTTQFMSIGVLFVLIKVVLIRVQTCKIHSAAGVIHTRTLTLTHSAVEFPQNKNVNCKQVREIKHNAEEEKKKNRNVQIQRKQNGF